MKTLAKMSTNGGQASAVEYQVDEDRDIHPDHEGEEADERQPPEILAGAAPDGAEHGGPGQGLARFEAARDFVHADGAEGGEQRKAHDQGITEVPVARVDGEPDDQRAAERVKAAEKHSVFRRPGEVLYPLLDAFDQVGDADLPDLESVRVARGSAPAVAGGSASAIIAIRPLPFVRLFSGVRRFEHVPGVRAMPLRLWSCLRRLVCLRRLGPACGAWSCLRRLGPARRRARNRSAAIALLRCGEKHCRLPRVVA